MLTFLGTLFAIGTLWFWFLLLIDFVAITTLVENEEGVWATVVAIFSIIGLNYLWKLPIAATIKANPGHTILLILSYFAIGVCWSIAKWYFFLHKENRKYENAKAEFLTGENAKELTGQLAAKMFGYLQDHNNNAYYEKQKINATPPLVSKHIDKLTRWATYWPFSMVGFALNDVVRKTWNYIFELLQGTYQRISNYVFRGAAADVAMFEEFKAKKATADGENPSRRRGY
jgi:hypothetical protein